MNRQKTGQNFWDAILEGIQNHLFDGQQRAHEISQVNLRIKGFQLVMKKWPSFLRA